MSDLRAIGKLDDVTWHTEAEDYPESLPPESAATHTGMFLAWAIHRGKVSQSRLRESAGSIKAVLEKRMTGAEFLLRECDGKLLFDDLVQDAQNFAETYLLGEYLDDYCRLFVAAESVYAVPDTWSNYELLEPEIDRRYAEWRGSPER